MSTRQRPSSPSDGAPMRPVEFYILLALARRDRHGYAIIQATERQSHGAVRLDPGTLYRAISRLGAAGLLRESDATAVSPDARRRTYTLTRAGRRAATAEAQRLHGLVRAAADAELLEKPEPA